MNYLLLALALFAFNPSVVSAQTIVSGTYKVIKVLSGDVGVITDHKGNDVYMFYLAGCSAPNLDSPFYQQSKKNLEKLVLNKTVSVVGVKATDEKMLVKIKISGDDACANQIRNGFAQFDEEDSSGVLGSSEKSSYKVNENKAKYAKTGLWKNADAGQYNPSQKALNKLQLYKFEQDYVNGTANPKHEDFGRPKIDPAPKK